MGGGVMKKCISVFSALVIAFSLFAVCAKGLDADALSAQCAALMCVQTGELLFEKNAHIRRSMASTTKIMTSVIALEQLTPQKSVKVSQKMIDVEGTSLGLARDDVITLESLVWGMMLESGNDAANAAACAVAGSAEKFAVLMNKKAESIGMKDTCFVTPSGLDDENHYSTAYDMALLGCYAVKNPEFLNICSSKKGTVFFGNPPCEHTVYNHNRLLSYYDSALGIKTGFTKKSGRCLVSCAEKDGVMLVAVTLNAPGDWADHKKLLDYGFSVVKPEVRAFDGLEMPVVGGVKDRAVIQPAELTVLSKKASFRVFTEKFIYAPVEKGETVGEVCCFLDGKIIERVPLIAGEDIPALPAETQPKKEKSGFIKRLFG